jgi:hypothetical protein
MWGRCVSVTRSRAPYCRASQSRGQRATRRAASSRAHRAARRAAVVERREGMGGLVRREPVSQRRVEHEKLPQEALPHGPTPDVQKVNELDKHPRRAARARAHGLDEAPQARHEAVVARAQERPRGHVANARGLHHEGARSPVGETPVPLQHRGRHESLRARAPRNHRRHPPPVREGDTAREPQRREQPRSPHRLRRNGGLLRERVLEGSRGLPHRQRRIYQGRRCEGPASPRSQSLCARAARGRPGRDAGRALALRRPPGARGGRGAAG